MLRGLYYEAHATREAGACCWRGQRALDCLGSGRPVAARRGGGVRDLPGKASYIEMKFKYPVNKSTQACRRVFHFRSTTATTDTKDNNSTTAHLPLQQYCTII